jgi:hypothetical protein
VADLKSAKRKRGYRPTELAINQTAVVGATDAGPLTLGRSPPFCKLAAEVSSFLASIGVELYSPTQHRQKSSYCSGWKLFCVVHSHAPAFAWTWWWGFLLERSQANLGIFMSISVKALHEGNGNTRRDSLRCIGAIIYEQTAFTVPRTPLPWGGKLWSSRPDWWGFCSFVEIKPTPHDTSWRQPCSTWLVRSPPLCTVACSSCMQRRHRDGYPYFERIT